MAKNVQISYSVGNGFKPPIRLSVGQWWLYRDSKRWDWPEIPENISTLKAGLDNINDERICAVVIVDLTLGPYGGEEVKVEFMTANDKHSPYLKGEMAWFVDQNFSEEEGYFTPFWTPISHLVYKNATKPVGIQYGVDCLKCKKHYPHAERIDGFTCWPCRNGY